MVCKRNVLWQGIMLLGILSTSLEDCVRKFETSYECIGRPEAGTCNPAYYNNVFALRCYSVSNLTELNNWQYNQWNIRISNSSLYEIKRDSFRHFQVLLRLSMSENNITYLEPGSFNGLSSLEYLNLSYNNIPMISKGVFNAMYKLVSLDLSHNNIDSFDRRSFTGTDNLRFLYLNENKIFEMPSFPGDCCTLLLLDVSNNAIEELYFIKSCSLLRTLNVANNNISVFSAEELSSSTTDLDLSIDKLHYINSNVFKNLTKLQNVDLSRNPLFEVNDVPVDLFRYMKLLQALNLSSTSIKKLSVGTFSQLQSLTVLDLSSNNLTYLPNGIFHDIGKLNELYINKNRLSYFQYDGLANIIKINLNDNLWNCDLLSAIIKKLRSNTIIRGDAYNETNVYGISCYEDLKDFEKADTYNSSDFDSLQNEYIAHVIRMRIDMSDIFAQLGLLVNETNKNQDDLQVYLNETMKLYESSKQTELSRINSTLTKIVSMIESLQKTATTAVGLEQGNQDAFKQLIHLQKIILYDSEKYMKQIIELQRNYSVDYWQMFELIQKDLGQAQDDACKKYETLPTNRTDIIALYCIFILVLAVFSFIVLLQFKKYKILTRNHEENPLNTLEI